VEAPAAYDETLTVRLLEECAATPAKLKLTILYPSQRFFVVMLPPIQTY